MTTIRTGRLCNFFSMHGIPQKCPLKDLLWILIISASIKPKIQRFMVHLSFVAISYSKIFSIKSSPLLL